MPPAGIPFHATPMPSLRDPESPLAFLGTLAAMPFAFIDASLRIAIHRPNVCVTSGGVVSLPIVLAARALRVPVYLWEGNAIPGRANRILAGFSSCVGVSFDAARRFLPRGRTVLTGTPIRASLLRWTREEGRAAFGIASGARLVLVGGGSQGSERLNDAVFGALARLLKRAYVVHLVGTEHAAKAAARRGALPDYLQERYVARDFLGDDMGAAIAAADLVVGRAGSSSIAEPLAFGVPLVLVPLGVAMNAHQDANARAAVDAGAAVVVSEGELDADHLGAVVLGLLDDVPRLGRMAAAARAAGRTDAAGEIARSLRAIGGCA